MLDDPATTNDAAGKVTPTLTIAAKISWWHLIFLTTYAVRPTAWAPPKVLVKRFVEATADDSLRCPFNQSMLGKFGCKSSLTISDAQSPENPI